MLQKYLIDFMIRLIIQIFILALLYSGKLAITSNRYPCILNFEVLLDLLRPLCHFTYLSIYMSICELCQGTYLSSYSSIYLSIYSSLYVLPPPPPPTHTHKHPTLLFSSSLVYKLASPCLQIVLLFVIIWLSCRSKILMNASLDSARSGQTFVEKKTENK